MHLRTIHLLCFSPTRSTRAIAASIADTLATAAVVEGGTSAAVPVVIHDLTDADVRSQPVVCAADELVVVAMPVYYGRIPCLFHDALPLVGQQTPAVYLTVYGNRAYEDALLELKNLGDTAGCVAVAAGAFVAEHSLNGRIATGRPDDADKAAMHEFGLAVARKLAALPSMAAMEPLQVPGHTPYRPYGANPMVPGVNSDMCTACGQCVHACPVRIISPVDFTVERRQDCLFCLACVKVCPSGARCLTVQEEAAFSGLMEKISQLCVERQDAAWSI